MRISGDHQIKDLQWEFNRCFPYLWIEFYYPLNGKIGQKAAWDSELKIKDIRKSPTLGYIPAQGYQKVGRFEQLFEKTFGLQVQVYRKSGGKWLPTYATDIWTLEEQNYRGRIMSEKDNPQKFI